MTKIQLNFQTALKFVKFLTGSPDTPLTWQTFADKKGLLTGKPQIFHGPLAQVWPRIVALNRKGQGIFLTIQETDLQGRETHNIKALRACFVDFDPPTIDGKKRPFNEQEQAEIRARLAAAPLPPTGIVYSGAGIHAYWLLEPGQPLEQFRDAQKALIHFFDTDKAVHDLPRVMRLPGTVHLKADPRAVEIAEVVDLPRVTLEQIRAAYPLPKPTPPKPTSRKYTFSSEPDLCSFDGIESEYDHALNMTRNYVLAAARSSGEGSRHDTLKSTLSRIVGRLKPADALSLVLEFSQVTGLPEAEALALLDWSKTNESRIDRDKIKLPIKKLNTRRCKEVKSEGLTKEQIRKDLYEQLASIMYTPDRRFHLVSVTAGTGKTAQLASVLNELFERAWPKREDNTEARILVLVDTHALAKEFKDLLTIPVQIYKGRGAENCEQWDVIQGSENPAGYCKFRCPVYKEGACTYYADKKRVLAQKLIIAPKQAFLNESVNLENYDIVIADEDLTSHLYHNNKTFDREKLHDIKKAVDLAEINQKQKSEAKAFIDGLLAEMDAPKVGEKVLKRKAPTIAHEEIERWFELGKGQYLTPPRFFGLLNGGRYDLSVTTGKEPRLHVTARREMVIGMLKNATVINLDATPIDCLLSEFEPEVFKRDLPQNAVYWQDADYAFTKGMLKQEKHNGIANDRIRAIYERTEGKTAAFTHKYDRENMTAMLPPGAQVGIYGADSKGTNKFEDCDNLILKGIFTPRVSALQALARVAGVKADRLIRERKDAELAQVIGRARAVNRLKPINIFILTNGGKHYALKLDKKPKPLREFFKNTKIRELKTPEPALSEVFASNQTLGSINIEPAAGENIARTGFEAIKKLADCITGKSEPEALKQIRTHVENCLIKYGFYVHDLAGFGTGSFCTEALEPLPEITKRTYDRYIQQVLNRYQAERVVLDEGQAVKVWGDKQAAIDFVTDPRELAEAIAHVKAEYNRPGGLLNMVFTLQEFNIQTNVRQWLEDRDYTRDNWAVLVLRIHKRRQAESLAAV